MAKTPDRGGTHAGIVRPARHRTRKSRESRYAQLLECAIDACAEKGIARATHGDVAIRAHVSLPTVFFYFPNRHALIDSVLTKVEQFLMTKVAPAGAAPRDAGQIVIEMVMACAECVVTQPAYIRVWLDWSTAIGNPAWPRYLKFNNRITVLFKRVLDAGKKHGSVPASLDTAEAARIVVGESHMLALMGFSGVKQTRLRAFVEHLVSAALHYSA
jgi:TetR/AcrR family transcriptional regulator, hemagglutinin/protease regulatory protein